MCVHIHTTKQAHAPTGLQFHYSHTRVSFSKRRVHIFDRSTIRRCALLCVRLHSYPSLTVHGVLAVGEELGQSPEGIFLIQVHEQNGSDLTHPLAVAHLLRGGDRLELTGWPHERNYSEFNNTERGRDRSAPECLMWSEARLWLCTQ